MSTQPTYPGVYIEEVPSGVYTITGVSTSITAFVGRAKRGSIDKPVKIFSFRDYEREFGGLWNKSTMSFAVRDFFENGGREAIIVRIHKNATVAEFQIPSASADPNDELNLIAVDPGTWGNKLSVNIDYKTQEPTDTNLFNIFINEEDGATEKFFNVTIDNTKPDYLPRVLEQGSRLMRVGFMPQDMRPIETIAAHTSESPSMRTPAPAIQGSDGDHITDAEIFSKENMEVEKKGMYMLEKIDLFNIICTPPYVSADSVNIILEPDDRPTDVSTELIAAVAAYCKKRRVFFIIDPHSTWKNKQEAVDGLLNSIYPKSHSSYAGLYFPRLKQRNPLMDNQIEEFAPCGAIAGSFARTDAQRGIWKAAAGQDVTVNGAIGLSVSLSDEENGELNQVGINCVRSIPVTGIVVWGARTLDGADRRASEWKYIPVRRTALFIEESLYRITKWVVFEPNDETLYSQVRLNIGAFMFNLFRQGAFQGATPREAYFVKCDSETTTQNDINQGIVKILVGFAPLKPAEFVILRIQQMAGMIET